MRYFLILLLLFTTLPILHAENKDAFEDLPIDESLEDISDPELPDIEASVEKDLPLPGEDEISDVDIEPLTDEKIITEENNPELNAKALKHFEDGKKYFEKNWFKSSVRELTAALKLCAYADNCDTVQKMLSEAKSGLLKRDKKIASYISKGNKYNSQGLYSKAISQFKLVQRFEKGNKEASEGIIKARMEIKEYCDKMINRSQSQYSSGDIIESVKTINTLLEKYPENKKAKTVLTRLKPEIDKEAGKLYKNGVTRYSENDVEGALQVWKKSLELKPDDEKVKEYVKRAEKRLKAVKELNK